MSTLSRDSYGGFAPTIRPGTAQNVTVVATSTQSAALPAGTTMVRLVSTQDCFVAFGPNPTATTSSTSLRSGVAEYFGVAKGDLIAVIRASADGSLNITAGSVYTPAVP
jgi:hypothetical protein